MKLQLQHLSKCYGAKQAVNDVSTTLTPGVYGLLGANGAGKTTLMRMICGVLKPTSGRICLDGKTIEELGERYYSHLGYMPQDFGFYPDFTAREFMLYMAAVKGLDKKPDKGTIRISQSARRGRQENQILFGRHETAVRDCTGRVKRPRHSHFRRADRRA